MKEKHKGVCGAVIYKLGKPLAACLVMNCQTHQLQAEGKCGCGKNMSDHSGITGYCTGSENQSVGSVGTTEPAKDMETRFDIECGMITLMDHHCGDIEYKELAHWKEIKSFISKELSKAQEETARGILACMSQDHAGSLTGFPRKAYELALRHQKERLEEYCKSKGINL